MKTIFFGNLPIQTTKVFIKDVTDQFGRGYNIRIIPIPQENNKIYGFADMVDNEADRLLDFFKNHVLFYKDYKINIKLAKGEISKHSAKINKYKAKRRDAIINRKKR